MIQFFILGSSSAYGVGSESGGWAEMLKQHLHTRMYANGGTGEKYELFNFAKSGAKVEFVQRTYKEQIESYKKSGKSIVLIDIGTNNTKAENDPTNFVSTPEQFKIEITKLLSELQNTVDIVLFVGGGWVDETKTNPKENSDTGRKSYFTNSRKQQFKEVLKNICLGLNIEFIELGVGPEEWVEKYVFKDGLHPNQVGHELIFKKVLVQIDPLLQ